MTYTNHPTDNRPQALAVSLIGAPTDIGASVCGASMGPEAMRVAGLQAALDARNKTVPVYDNLTHETSTTSRDNPLALLTGLTMLVALTVGFFLVQGPANLTNRLLIAPMIGGLGACFHGDPLPAHLASDPAYQHCHDPDGSAALAIEATLAPMASKHSSASKFDLGYTLHVPLLKFLVRQGSDWAVDPGAIQRLVNTVARNERHLVMYLFSTHFSAGSTIEPILAADPRNMAELPSGIMGRDKYYGMDVYPWSIARTDNDITRYRIHVIEAISRALCEQPQAVRDRLLGITLLGETHHHFPSFESGMGFGGRYEVSDYSDASITSFRTYLAQRFGTVQALSAVLGNTQLNRFEDVMPPAKDIHNDKLRSFSEHIDAYANGQFPVSGWLATDPRLTSWVRIYLNGTLVARVKASLGRQDVLFHRPELGTSDVGWRHDIDFRDLPYGTYNVTAMAETVNGSPWLMDNRTVSVMRPDKSPSLPTPSKSLPVHEINQPWVGSVDEPRSSATYFYNPLAAIWQDFRGLQVVRYLQFIERPLQAGCLAPIPRYVHQLIPFPNPSWDDQKYAVGPSLEAIREFQLGVSLYGEASYGRSFFDWKEKHRRSGYGVTEFHPLKGMDAAALRRTLADHQDHGARFVSFFMEARGITAEPSSTEIQNFLSFDPANTARGSNQLYRSVQELLGNR